MLQFALNLELDALAVGGSANWCELFTRLVALDLRAW